MEGGFEMRPHLESQLRALAQALKAVRGARVLLHSGRKGSVMERGMNTVLHCGWLQDLAGMQLPGEQHAAFRSAVPFEWPWPTTWARLAHVQQLLPLTD